jgi:ferredoxin-NADP reductase
LHQEIKNGKKAMNHEVEILSMKKLNHSVVQFELQRPNGYSFQAGQAIELTIDNPEPKGPAPFTFTGLVDAPNLELMIKIYDNHAGLTSALSKKKPGEKVLITDPWDSFTNKGHGVFLAGGAGITPFVALLRQLDKDKAPGQSFLFFSNKTRDDIFLKDELNRLLGDRYLNIITSDPSAPHIHINEDYIRKHINNFSQPFYVCGPPGFTENVQNILAKIGASEEMINISF